MHKVLAVHHDADMLDLMAEVVQERFPDVIVECAHTALAAVNHCRAQMGDPFRAVIASRSIAPDRKTGLNDTEHKGMEFLESLGEFAHAGVPKILISSTESASLISRIRNLPNCQLLLLDDSSRFEDSFVKIITGALERSEDEPKQVEEEPKQVKVVVSLNLAKQLWEYEVKGVGFPYETNRTTLQIDTQTLEDLVSRSRRAARNQDDWEKELLEIGRDFGRLLLYGNPPFLKELSEAKAKAGGPEKCSICFSIEKSVHPAVLEALTDPKEESFWMLKEPMYRRLIRSTPQAPKERTALFKGRSNRPEQFNALIIESPAEGAVSGLSDRKGHPLRLPQLRNVTPEAEVVEQILRKQARRVRRIGPKSLPAGSSFKSYVRDVLSEDRWDLVHYAGHSYYDENEEKGKGYLFLPGEFVEALDIEMLNTYLQRAQTRFIYLSGCQSSETGFVFELARLQIPAVLGFRWPIHDEPALEFARKFYEELFRSRAPCLEKAFLATRCAIRDMFHQDKIWAAAMLILQDTD